jgi:hypothetical protein
MIPKKTMRTIDKSEELAVDIAKLLHGRSLNMVQLVTAFACTTCDMTLQVDGERKVDTNIDAISELCDLYKDMVIGFLTEQQNNKLM